MYSPLVLQKDIKAKLVLSIVKNYPLCTLVTSTALKNLLFEHPVSKHLLYPSGEAKQHRTKG